MNFPMPEREELIRLSLEWGAAIADDYFEGIGSPQTVTLTEAELAKIIAASIASAVKVILIDTGTAPS